MKKRVWEGKRLVAVNPAQITAISLILNMNAHEMEIKTIIPLSRCHSSKL